MYVSPWCENFSARDGMYVHDKRMLQAEDLAPKPLGQLAKTLRGRSTVRVCVYTKHFCMQFTMQELRMGVFCALQEVDSKRQVTPFGDVSNKRSGEAPALAATAPSKPIAKAVLQPSQPTQPKPLRRASSSSSRAVDVPIEVFVPSTPVAAKAPEPEPTVMAHEGDNGVALTFQWESSSASKKTAPASFLRRMDAFQAAKQSHLAKLMTEKEQAPATEPPVSAPAPKVVSQAASIPVTARPVKQREAKVTASVVVKKPTTDFTVQFGSGDPTTFVISMPSRLRNQLAMRGSSRQRHATTAESAAEAPAPAPRVVKEKSIRRKPQAKARAAVRALPPGPVVKVEMDRTRASEVSVLTAWVNHLLASHEAGAHEGPAQNTLAEVRREAKVRLAAFKLYHGAKLEGLRMELERQVASGRLAVRPDKEVHLGKSNALRAHALYQH